jgi:ferredoxin-NADP reductase
MPLDRDADAPRLLVAGGIGITPIYGMALALDDRNAPFRMVYGGKSRRSMAFADKLHARLGDRLALSKVASLIPRSHTPLKLRIFLLEVRGHPFLK